MLGIQPQYSVEIAAGVRTALKTSGADFIKNASGIEERHVMEVAGLLIHKAAQSGGSKS